MKIRSGTQTLRVVIVGILVSTLIPLTAVPVAALGSSKPDSKQISPSSDIGTQGSKEGDAKNVAPPGKGEIPSQAGRPLSLANNPNFGHLGHTLVPPPAKKAVGYEPDKSVELPEKRDVSKTVFKNADGTETAQFSTTPMHVKSASGKWEKIDNTLLLSGGRVKGKFSTPGVDLASSASDKKLAAVEFDKDHAVEFALAGASNVTGKTDGNVQHIKTFSATSISSTPYKTAV